MMGQPFDPNIHPTIEEGAISRTYGTKYMAPIVKLSSKTARICYQTVVFPYKHDRPEIRVEHVAVSYQNNPCPSDQASALCVTISQHDRIIHDYYFVKHTPLPGEYSFGTFTHEGTLRFIRMDGTGKILFQHSI